MNEAKPKLLPLVGISATVAFVGVGAVALGPIASAMSQPAAALPFALASAMVAAIAALLVGVPLTHWALRAGLRQWWHAVVIGTLTSGMTPLITALPLLLNPARTGSIAGAFAGLFSNTALVVAPFGAATGFIYWLFYVRAVPTPRWIAWSASGACVVGVAIVFAGATAVQQRQNIAATSRVLYSPAGPGAASYKLTRAFDSDVDVARFVSSARPGCALLVKSSIVTAAIPVGAEVWVDLTQAGRSPAVPFRVSRIGEITDASVLLQSTLSECAPWD